MLNILKSTSALAFLLCVGALLVAYFYFQLWLGLFPCPLCILDRWILAALALGFFLQTFKLIPYLAIQLWQWLFLLAGFVVGGRHIWLERFPPTGDAINCFPAQASGLINWLTNAFVGTADCSQIPWQFLSLSIADWTFILYILLAVLLLTSRPKAESSN